MHNYSLRTVHDLDAAKAGAEIIQLHVLSLPSKAVEEDNECCLTETIACIDIGAGVRE